MKKIVSKDAHLCALCKHWEDFSYSHIERREVISWFINDSDAKEFCQLKKIKMNATAFCSSFNCKVK